MKRTMILMLTLLVTWSCSVGRQIQSPEYNPTVPAALQTPPAERFNAREPVAAWWSQLEDEQLVTLVSEALAHNHDVRVALANLDEARALTRGIKRDRLPTIGVNAAAQQQRSSDEGLFGPLPDRDSELYDVGFEASWELDLFGRVRNRILAGEARLRMAEADVQGVYVSVAVETARAYIDLRGAQYRLDVAQRNAANQRKTHELILALADAGRGDQLNVARARTQLELTQAGIPILSAEINAVLNRLALLTGDTVPDLRDQLAAVKPLPTLPDSVAVGDARGLLARRPDIRRAEHALAEATARYNLNVAELYPKVSLFGSLGFSATSLGDLAGASALTGGIGPRLQWSAFNLGRVRAHIDAADARTRAQLATFERSVLAALHETDAAMVGLTRAEESRARLREAAKAGAEAVELARLRFDAGVDDFLDVLDAERTLLLAEERLAQGEIETVQNLINVYQALGGGWQTAADSGS
ncbi:efflux transporter outer membrane subunit [Acanthopleuribacter pedis]|uniref:TolC family protein n=1 Tax=Acanthopleuribacter pedis TaxID=442870 RepID=A0A8J7U4A9_9BACT|nr:TolC family protein [Acanthopleuribacter pedis]MBO1321303.1 TolC family protein [Acanthopleuribacter pedis]